MHDGTVIHDGEDRAWRWCTTMVSDDDDDDGAQCMAIAMVHGVKRMCCMGCIMAMVHHECIWVVVHDAMLLLVPRHTKAYQGVPRRPRGSQRRLLQAQGRGQGG